MPRRCVSGARREEYSTRGCIFRVIAASGDASAGPPPEMSYAPKKHHQEKAFSVLLGALAVWQQVSLSSRWWSAADQNAQAAPG
jgi:hypothetical protein